MSGSSSPMTGGGVSRSATIRRLPSLPGRRAVEAHSLTQPQPSGRPTVKSSARQEVMEAALDANGDRGDNSVPPGSQGNFPQLPSATPEAPHSVLCVGAGVMHLHVAYLPISWPDSTFDRLSGLNATTDGSAP